MRVGISTACLYPDLLEKSLPKLTGMGFRLFEIFFNTFSELKPPFVELLHHTAMECGGEIKSIHPFTSGFEGFLLFSDYARRFEDGLEFYKRYFETAGRLGAKLMVLHGQRDYRRGRITEPQYLERYASLYEAGKSFGITVAQENVNAFRSEDPAFIQRMRACLGENCAFVFDIKQAVRAGVDPYQMCEAMGERLVHVHLNDNAPGADCLLPGCGVMDYQRLLHMLCSFGFHGDLIIEVYRHNFGVLEDLLPAKALVEGLLGGCCESFT